MPTRIRDPESTEAAHTGQPASRDWPEWIRWATRQPTTVALGLEPRKIDDGRVLADVRRSTLPLNPNGALHGGLVAAVIDQLGSLAATTRVQPGQGVLTCTLNIEYLRPAMLPISGTGLVVRSSRSIHFAHIELFSGDDLCAAGSGTWITKSYASMGGVV